MVKMDGTPGAGQAAEGLAAGSRPRKSLGFSQDEGFAAVVTAQPLQTYCCICVESF